MFVGRYAHLGRARVQDGGSYVQTISLKKYCEILLVTVLVLCIPLSKFTSTRFELLLELRTVDST